MKYFKLLFLCVFGLLINCKSTKTISSTQIIESTESSIILDIKAVNPEYIKVEYPDLLSGDEHEKRTFYVGDRSSPWKCWWVGNKRMEGLSFDLIER